MIESKGLTAVFRFPANTEPSQFRSLACMLSPRSRAALALALLAGCGGGTEAPPPAPAPADSGESAAAPSSAEEVLAKVAEREGDLFDPSLPPRAGWMEDDLLRRDPAYDGWTSEVLQGLAKESLQRLLAALEAGESTWTEELDPGFEGAPALVPAEPERISAAGGARVRRGTCTPQGPLLPLDRRFGELLAFYGPGEPPREAHKIVGVELSGGGRFVTRALLELSARRGSRRMQQNLTWELEWVTSGQGDERRVRLTALRPGSYEDVALPAPLFADVTTSVFGGVPRFDQELRKGVDQYHMHSDRLFGQSFLGMQGLAVGDLTGDGLDDVYVCMHGGIPNRLFARRADGTVEDVSAASKLDFLDVTRSALILDFDGDGFRDLAAAIGNSVVVCYNSGRGTFLKRRRVWLTSESSEDFYSLSAADPDGDGDLDIYAVRYVAGGVVGGVPTPYYDAQNGASNVFWRNDGPGQWSDATGEVGLDQDNSRFSLASVWEDFDQDGDVDLYVTNDFGRNNLYQNEGGHFRDVAGEAGASDQASGMGATVADVDRDGDTDLYVSNMFSSAGLRVASQHDLYMGGRHQELHRNYLFHARGNTLLLNQGDGTFSDATEQAGVALGRWAWGAVFCDFQNDGLADIYVPNGFVTSRSDPNDL